MNLLALKGLVANKLLIGVTSGVIAAGGTGAYVGVGIHHYNKAVEEVNFAQNQVNSLDLAVNKKIDLVKNNNKLESLDKKQYNEVTAAVKSAENDVEKVPSWKNKSLLESKLQTEVDPKFKKAEDYNTAVNVAKKINSHINDLKALYEKNPLADGLDQHYKSLSDYINKENKVLAQISNNDIKNLFNQRYVQAMNDLGDNVSKVTAVKNALSDLHNLGQTAGTTKEAFDAKAAEVENLLGSVSDDNVKNQFATALTNLKSGFGDNNPGGNTSSVTAPNVAATSANNASGQSNVVTNNNNGGVSRNNSNQTTSTTAAVSNRQSSANTGVTSKPSSAPSVSAPAPAPASQPAPQPQQSSLLSRVTGTASNYGMTTKLNPDSTISLYTNGAYFGTLWSTGFNANPSSALTGSAVADIVITGGCPLDRGSLVNAVNSVLASKGTETIGGVTISGFPVGISMHW